jgi:hypothetical protein
MQEVSHLHYASGLRPGDVFPQEPINSPIIKHRKHFSENDSKNRRFQGQKVEPTFAKKTLLIGTYGHEDFKLYYMPPHTGLGTSTITKIEDMQTAETKVRYFLSVFFLI